ncbi:MAG: helix-turn-helix transcriptional regulator [Clostridia bacterium]|nr:helix-turn-helix transcriptional regulator [Clostridia bacterium]
MDYLKNKPSITIRISDMKFKIIRFGIAPEMGFWPVDRDMTKEPGHTHLNFEAIFVTQGELEVRTHEKNMKFERKIVIIPPNLSHYTVPRQDGCFCVLFKIENSKHDNSKAGYLNDYLSKDISAFELSDDVDYYIRAFARKSKEGTPSAEKDAALLAELIFREIISFIPAIDTLDDFKHESWCIDAIENYINSHLREKITLSDVAKHVYMSNKQVSRIIMREYGVTLSELVIQKKLHVARALLKNTDMKIKEVAARVNLGIENYFYTMFKKRYGISPLEYRKKCRDEN